MAVVTSVSREDLDVSRSVCPACLRAPRTALLMYPSLVSIKPICMESASTTRSESPPIRQGMLPDAGCWVLGAGCWILDGCDGGDADPINPADFIRYHLIYGGRLGPRQAVQMAGDVERPTMLIKCIDGIAERSCFITFRVDLIGGLPT